VLLDKGALLMKDRTDKIIDFYLKDMIPLVDRDNSADRKDRAEMVQSGLLIFIEDEKGNVLKTARSGMSLVSYLNSNAVKITPKNDIVSSIYE
jgi:hypothetical protein